MGKNIVVMCDGTWNGSDSGTNVHALYDELLQKDDQQLVLYLDGIGVGEKILDFIIDGAIALNLDKKIKEGYKYIVKNYYPGDDIWLFGFSRGAYTVRCIAGMINNCGIIKLDNDIQTDQIDELIDQAYNIYRNRDDIYHPDGYGSDNFKKEFSYPDPEKLIIKFLGLWDTVGAYGLPGYEIGKGFEYLQFYDLNLSDIVNFACQALAIHERRSFFEPCHILPSKSGKTITKETWFPGVHSEIGGGKSGGNERISMATMSWMLENIEQVGGLLMKDNIETYRTRFHPDHGLFWNLENLIFDHINKLIPARDRVIPLELDSSKKFLKEHLLYKGGDWLSIVGSRTNLIKQYPSNTYEELRKKMEKEEIKLYNNIEYDNEVIERVVEEETFMMSHNNTCIQSRERYIHSIYYHN